ncbi:carbohydrate ABC transporter membrane protein 1, CUT1 family [Sulfobacillus acidophilus DSM 10332]|uniref:Carbohydrate ABC transporter membrane protein 1, CUT1 family n=1 Tax=Sulfobacillus acidophilus (strain ATCC 700253 / DSM 10332 / NAL) TaxID=679936 RepID=G8TU69_SULAD|nr:carbohydrate ABC transporter membrane protein 1, CUT1 family [Sulfobacillus acidophilus DSM 10332]
MYRQKHLVLLFLGPALATYLIFIVYPFISSFHYSLFNWNGIGPLNDYVGLGNYAYVLFSHQFSGFFWRAIAHNLVFFVISMVLTLFVGLGLAIALMAISEKVARWFQVIYFIPLVIPPVVVAYLWAIYLEPNFGLIATIGTRLHIAFLQLPFLGSQTLALPVIAVITAWAGMGFPILVFLASLMDIPKELLDAAKIDGANSFQTFWSVTLPMIKPTIFTIMTLNFVGSFGVFDLIYIMEGTQAGPNYSTDVLGTLFYRTAFGGFGTTAQNMGLATALAVIGFGLVMLASGLFVYLQRRSVVEF